MTASINHIEVMLFMSNLLNLKTKQKEFLIILWLWIFSFCIFFFFFDTLKVYTNTMDWSDIERSGWSSGLRCLKKKKITHFFSIVSHVLVVMRITEYLVKKNRYFFKLMVTLKIKHSHLPVFQSIFCFPHCRDRKKFKDKEVIWINCDAKRNRTYQGGGS